MLFIKNLTQRVNLRPAVIPAFPSDLLLIAAAGSERMRLWPGDGLPKRLSGGSALSQSYLISVPGKIKSPRVDFLDDRELE